MKTVFNNSQLAHVFIAQTQSEGRNSGNSFYFRYKQIWSYGSHYLAAEIYKIKGKQIVLINSHKYSNSTSKHLDDIHNAANHLTVFSVKDPGDPKNSLAILHYELAEEYYNYFNVIKPRYWSTEERWNNFRNRIEEFNSACNLFNCRHLKITLTNLHRDLWSDKHKQLVKRQAELNTPEMLAKKEAKRLANEAKRTALVNAKVSDAIKLWKLGGQLRSDIADMKPQLIRIKKDSVETTGGAKVPLQEALIMFKGIKKGWVKEGARIGAFTYNGIQEDKIIIGCHAIQFIEAEKVLKEFIK